MTGAVPMGVPWYVHPAEAPDLWAALPRTAGPPTFLVLNVNNGPGAADDPYYPAAIERLGSLVWLGYVDLDYGRRPPAEVQADILAWRHWYGATGVMFDRVPSALTIVVEAAVEAARAAGCATVAGNPGTQTSAELAALFDIVCVAEDSAVRYLAHGAAHRLPAAARAASWHLVHSCPAALAPAVLEQAHSAGADYLFVTDAQLPHPWSGWGGLDRRLSDGMAHLSNGVILAKEQDGLLRHRGIRRVAAGQRGRTAGR